MIATMPTRLDGKTVIVTGAARGLGRAMALALAEAGANVAVLDLPASAPEAQSVVAAAASVGARDRICVVIADATVDDEVRRAADEVEERYGPIYGLVNNAARGMQDFGPVQVGPRKKFYEAPPALWRDVIHTNVNGPFTMARWIAPRLVANGRGRIVNLVTSFRTMQAQGFSPYGPSKAALEAATVIWAKDLEGSGVTVNALLPGGAANTRMIPQGEIPDRSQLVQPEAMRAPIVWLMSEESNHVTGSRFVAQLWDPAEDPRVAAAKSSAPAGFPG
jgi:NAD(P)-dependent dehydrogenase (short-subunit alcohol dehydrogenase family)